MNKKHKCTAFVVLFIEEKTTIVYPDIQRTFVGAKDMSVVFICNSCGRTTRNIYVDDIPKKFQKAFNRAWEVYGND